MGLGIGRLHLLGAIVRRRNLLGESCYKNPVIRTRGRIAMLRKSTFSGTASGAQLLIQRGIYAVLIMASLISMVGNKSRPDMFEQVRMSVLDTVSPVLETVSRPLDMVNAGVNYVGDVFNALDDARRLRVENQELVYLKSQLQRLQTENETLRTLSNYSPDEGLKYVTARVIGTQSASFARYLLVNQGQSQGVAKGQAALSKDGLLGRVMTVGDTTARVLLLTDLNSRLPVRIQQTNINAMLAGDNSTQPKLLYVPNKVKVETGQSLVTSGHGGIFPPGIPVGRIKSIGKDGTVSVTLSANLNTTDYLKLMGYANPMNGK